MANFQVLMSNSLTEDRAGPSFAKQQQQQQQEVEQALQAPAQAMKAHGVAVFKDSGEFLYRIGNEGVSCYPTGIDISSAGDLLIGDTHGYRFHVTCYGSDGVFKSVFEFPQLNVSRCCGLKITSEGYVVTLAKNNHQVLVMDLLYV
ncbi:GL16037 [Drosophila persimilis]|uniref:GL16037 n=1 Tax=Drosophila persimilis TaxID=7234 RepID=B4IR97_DROPE|nr:GL16037 [Drosophila persimilis]